jgi:hypothetical protein
VIVARTYVYTIIAEFFGSPIELGVFSFFWPKVVNSVHFKIVPLKTPYLKKPETGRIF